jgi:hypothetical protein
MLPTRTTDVAESLSSAVAEEKAKSQKCVQKIFRTIQFLARQGLLLCGDGPSEADENFNRVIKMMCNNEDADLATSQRRKEISILPRISRTKS